jgi:hypothetical protein
MGLNVAKFLGEVAISFVPGGSAVLLAAQLYGGEFNKWDLIAAMAGPAGKILGKVLGKAAMATMAYRTGRVVRTVGNVPKALLKGPKNTHVYIGYRKGKAVYVGITKQDLAKRQAQHGTRFIIKKITPKRLTRRQARAIEQVLYIRNPHFLNKKNPISARNNDWYQEAVEWGEAWLRQHFPSGT